MKKIVAALPERLALIAIVATVATLLHIYGGLGVSASIIFGVTFTVTGIWLHGLERLATFKPYRLVIGVNYAAIWEDFKLIPAEGPQFESVTLTAISSSIFARSDDREYSAHPDIYKDVPCGIPAWRGGFGEIKDVPTFFFRPHRDGYQFGVHVQGEWWKQHSPQLAKDLGDRQLAYDGTVKLGLLPYGFIPDHLRKWNEPVTIFGGFDRKQRKWKKRLKQEGWTFEDDYPTYLKHRYLGISYYDI